MIASVQLVNSGPRSVLKSFFTFPGFRVFTSSGLSLSALLRNRNAQDAPLRIPA